MTWARANIRILGLLTALAAAWGGIVAFAGPSFSFDIVGTTSAWVWNTSHATIWFAAGLAGIVGGLLLFAGWKRWLQALGGLLAAVGGIWFLIGPAFEPLWTSSTGGVVGTSSGNWTRAWESIGYSYGVGALVLALAMLALGALATVRRPEPAPIEAERREAPVQQQQQLPPQQQPAMPPPSAVPGNGHNGHERSWRHPFRHPRERTRV
jgi:hypothetical protein